MSLSPLVDAVRSAVQLCQDVQAHALQGLNKFSQQKGESEPVTIADYGAQALIGRALSRYFPEDAVIAEESGAQFLKVTTEAQRADILARLERVLGEKVTLEAVVSWLDFGSNRTSSTRTWVIDPIDGTRGFIAQRHYAVCVGLLENGIPTEAVMGCPQYQAGKGAIFYAEKGVLYEQSLDGATTTQRRVSTRQDRPTWLAVQSYEDAHSGKRDANRVLSALGWAQEVSTHNIDSMEKYALVGVGDADMMIRLPNNSTRPHMIWDHVAGIALVLAGGGVATDYDGTPLDFTQGKVLPNRGMLVSSGIMHHELIRGAQLCLKQG